MNPRPFQDRTNDGREDTFIEDASVRTSRALPNPTPRARETTNDARPLSASMKPSLAAAQSLLGRRPLPVPPAKRAAPIGSPGGTTNPASSAVRLPSPAEGSGGYPVLLEDRTWDAHGYSRGIPTFGAGPSTGPLPPPPMPSIDVQCYEEQDDAGPSETPLPAELRAAVPEIVVEPRGRSNSQSLSGANGASVVVAPWHQQCQHYGSLQTGPIF